MMIKMRTRTTLKMKTEVMNSDITIGAGCSPLTVAKECINSVGFYVDVAKIRAELEPLLRTIEERQANQEG